MKLKFILIFLITLFLAGIMMHFINKTLTNSTWEFQSIDTMKYSRDLAREKMHDPKFASVVDKQMKQIAATGATHVAIATPYDEEFKPMLELWVDAARKHGLKVWFRGNWSGWEQWFEYKQIDQQTHIAKTEKFILDNKDLFKDGDVFSSCPECENGPEFQYSNPTEVIEYRKFLIAEYNATKKAFTKIDKDVDSNYFSMNADVAKAVMNRPTTQALDNRIVIDHYVASPDQLAKDVQTLAEQTGAKIVLGEIGAPIPDIHGAMTDEEQQVWVTEALQKLTTIDNLEGVNYWTNMGGTTALWKIDGSAKPVVETITKAFTGR